uniref:RCC1 and BTB domain-containing protein 1 n=1 Tax=Lygus hesperus TaxID=30085 RepID=A0A0A9VUP8_LYGHE
MSSSPTPLTTPYPTSKEELDEIIRKQLTLPLSKLVDRPFMKRLTGAELDNVKSFKVFRSQYGMATMFITIDDQVFGVGKNSYNVNILGLTGRYYRCEDVGRPVRIEKLSGRRIQALRLGELIGAALDHEGKLYWWGQNLMQKNEVITPTLITEKMKFSSVSCGRALVAAIDKQGHVYIWGNSSYNGGSPHYMKKLDVDGPVVGLSCGLYHLAMITEAGLVYTWGDGREGQRGESLIGECSEYDRNTVNILNLDFRCVAVICGTSSTFCISSTGDLWACGANGNGSGVLGVQNVDFCIGTPEKVLVPGKTIFHTAVWNLCGQTIYAAFTTSGLFWWCERSFYSPGSEASRLASDQTIAEQLNVFSSPHDSMIYVAQDNLSSSPCSSIHGSQRQPNTSTSTKIIRKLEQINVLLKTCRLVVNNEIRYSY